MSELRKIHGGYAKKAQREAAKAKPVVPRVPRPRPKPLPPGLPQALAAMAELSRVLRDITSLVFSVSVDYLDEWVLVVRGYEPAFDYFQGYTVKYIKSSLIRNPLTKRG